MGVSQERGHAGLMAYYHHHRPEPWVSMSLSGDIRINTGYRGAHNEAHALVRKILTQPGDVDPTVPGYLDITLDPLPTGWETAAAAELCAHLTETETRFPGIHRILRFAIRERTRALN